MVGGSIDSPHIIEWVRTGFDKRLKTVRGLVHRRKINILQCLIW